MRKQRIEQLKNNGKLPFRVHHNKFREAREKLDLSHEDVATILDVNPKYIGMVERGRRVGSVPFFFTLCHILQLNPAECVTVG